MSQGCALLILRSRSWGLMIENDFQTITDPVIHLWSWKFIHLLPMSQECAPFDFRAKGQGHGALVIENGYQTITDSVIHLWPWNFIHLLLMSQGCALLILGSKVLSYLGLKLVKDVPCSFNGFLHLSFLHLLLNEIVYDLVLYLPTPCIIFGIHAVVHMVTVARLVFLLAIESIVDRWNLWILINWFYFPKLNIATHRVYCTLIAANVTSNLLKFQFSFVGGPCSSSTL